MKLILGDVFEHINHVMEMSALEFKGKQYFTLVPILKVFRIRIILTYLHKRYIKYIYLHRRSKKEMKGDTMKMKNLSRN
jgi:hypothetical protein